MGYLQVLVLFAKRVQLCQFAVQQFNFGIGRPDSLMSTHQFIMCFL